MVNEHLTQKQVNDAIISALPSVAIDSAVALVMQYGKGIRVIGSGVLFRIEQKSFVLTAAHVVKNIQGTIYIVTKTGEHVSFVNGGYSERFDLAICEIPDHSIEKFRQNAFPSFAMAKWNALPEKAVFTFIGYPSIWADQDNAVLKPFQYTSYRYNDKVAGYKDELHLFMSAIPNELSDDGGNRAIFRSIDGMVLNFPSDLRGVSGSGVWIVGDLDIPIDLWSTIPPKLVGIESGAIDNPKVINIVKWIAVNTMICEAYPEFEHMFSKRNHQK